MEYYNGKLCISYDDLIKGNSKSNELQERPIISEGNYRSLCGRGKIKVVRRGCLGTPALIDYDSLPSRFKALVIAKYGDPKEASKRHVLKDMIVDDLKAQDFFSKYTFDGFEYLPADKQKEYTKNASALNAVARLVSDRTILIKALNGNTKGVWKEVSRALNAIQKEVGCNLPCNHLRLKDKMQQYQTNGYKCFISKKYGNQHASKAKQTEQKALLQELLGDGRNIDNETVAKLYNAVAVRMNWETVTSGTIGNYRKETELVTFAGRHGKTAYYNEKSMQIRRTKPTSPMYFWCVDGWDVELLYKSTAVNKNGVKVTTYHNRPTMVVVIDPFNGYPIGYAVGTHETPELIRKAFRNAFEHTSELFGNYYRPWQIQTDNYGRGNLTAFYEACTKHFTPARAHNAKSKVVEPWFNLFNKTCCRLCPNSSGYGVKTKSKMQPSPDFLAQQKKFFPDYDGCVAQLDQMIAYYRAERRDDYLSKWNSSSEDDRLSFSLAEYLNLFGETTGRVNSLQPDGVTLTLGGQKFVFDSFDREFREYGHSSFILKYDPENLNQVLAIENAGTDRDPVEGNVRFMLIRKFMQPMALRDRSEGDYDEMQRVNRFNADLDNYVIESRRQSRQVVDEFFEENAYKLNDTLTKHVLTDSLGQHKDRRNEVAGRASATAIMPAVAEEDYEVVFDKLDFLKSI